jgi:integrase
VDWDSNPEPALRAIGKHKPLSINKRNFQETRLNCHFYCQKENVSFIRRKRNSPYWFAGYTLPDGRQTQRSTKLEATRDNAIKARKIAQELEYQAYLAKQGVLMELQARKAITDIVGLSGLEKLNLTTTRTFLLEWLDSKLTTKARGTTNGYRFTIHAFIEHLKEKADAGLQAVRANDISTFRDKQVKQGKSNKTSNTILKTLRVPFNLARRQGIITMNPAEAVDLLPNESKTRETFSREQITDLLKACETDWEWKGLILFGACHGLRLGDIASLTWGNINSERNTLCFYPQKTSRGVKRKVEEYPLHTDIIKFLSSVPSKSKNSSLHLFPTLSQKRISGTGGLSLRFRKLMHKAGIYSQGEQLKKNTDKGRRFFELGFHSLRHTAISEMANHGVSKEIRMKLSGHKSDVHERYTHHEINALRNQIEKVPSYFNDSSD